MQYAFEEFTHIIDQLGGLDEESDEYNKKLRYACALVSELTYYHIEDFEADEKNKLRVKLVPCASYRELAASNRTYNLNDYLKKWRAYQENTEGPEPFVRKDDGIVSLNIPMQIKYNKVLFVGYRGTILPANIDLKINLEYQKCRIDIHANDHTGPPSSQGVYHHGYSAEAIRVNRSLRAEINTGKYDKIILTGHSLGGAIALISEIFINKSHCVKSIAFAAPRYLYEQITSRPPGQMVRRKDDIIPYFPPRMLGLIDHQNQIDIDGNRFSDSVEDEISWAFGRKCLFFFIDFMTQRMITSIKTPHDIDFYREELGRACNAKGYSNPLINLSEIEAKELG